MAARKRLRWVALGAVVVLAAAAGVVALTRGDDGDGAKKKRQRAFLTAISKQLPRPSGGAGGVRAVLVAKGFKEPVGAVTPPGQTAPLFVVERGGRVWRVANGRKERTPFLDLSREVSTDSVEQGLLGLAFAPDHRRSGRLYVYFSDRRGNIRLQEFRASSSARRVDPGTRRQLLFQRHPAVGAKGAAVGDRIHYAGKLEFGPDGRLYVAIGDGGPLRPTRRSQSLATPLGKILRIDPRPAAGRPYSIPADNPFVGRAGARGEIYAYGLRNPYRFSFDSETGDLWIGDVANVGQEEIDYGPRGKAKGSNFGWPCFEGDKRIRRCDPPGYVRPAISRPRSKKVPCSSIIGGYVVRDPELRSLRGRYLYTDFCEGSLRSARASGGRVTDLGSVGLSLPWTSSFGQDGDGRILSTGFYNGRVYRLGPA